LFISDLDPVYPRANFMEALILISPEMITTTDILPGPQGS